MLKEYFDFTRSERNSILALLGVLLFSMIIAGTISYLFPEDPINMNEYRSEIEQFLDSANLIYEKSEKVPEPDSLFYFNPNKTSEKQWMQLGLNVKQIQNIKNYLKKAGKFKYKDDFRSIYTISDSMYLRLEPYLILPSFAPESEEMIKNEVNIDSLYCFDPNTIKMYELERMGFPDFVIKNLISYRTSGGRFRESEDLKKIYGLDSVLFYKISSFIQIDSSSIDTTVFFPTPVSENTYLELNSADQSDLENLPGIGAVLASRIIKYRKMLGGFVSVTQLKEVYGIPVETYDNISPSVIVDTNLVQRMNINFVSREELSHHPYFSREIAKSVVRFRNKNGSFQYLESLIQLESINDSIYQKILPYLELLH